MSPTRKNHYVPIWYQRRFLPSGQDLLFYLDLNPERRVLPSGKTIVMNGMHQWSPKKCFFEKDLYTTNISGILNDEIERFLFGDIDNTGALAVEALVRGDLRQLHRLFIPAFEYLDAQKIRTPKGLAWVASQYPNLNQLELMLEMQQLRRMHCTMWVEAAREIVSAEDSRVKFIITDHPVTIFNPACPPNSVSCRYPNDPRIGLKGSQTLFPLDQDHCLILTNLEYSRSPQKVDPLSERTHARYFGQTLVKYDTMIRSRKLAEDDVTAINFVLKSRAHKFIAAANQEWLYPEKKIHKAWKAIGGVLLPPAGELWEFGGEIYVGGRDGKLAHYQDEFGRTLGEISLLKKRKSEGRIGVNDPCPCGSGKKYKKCCRDRKPSQRPSSEVYSIRERNIILFNATAHILGLSKGKTWEDVRRELSDDQVREIYKVFGSLWPSETNLADLLPHPDSTKLRALYTGIIDPRSISRTVLGPSLYFDEILMLNPFVNPASLREEYRPTTSPAQYKQETLKNIALFNQIIPFVNSGYVNLIPDPGDFDYPLRASSWEMAKERHVGWKPTDDELEQEGMFFKDDFTQTMMRLPDDVLAKQIKAAIPSISENGLQSTIAYIKKKNEQDPLLLLQPLLPGQQNAQLAMGHFGPNLEMAFYLSQIAGALVYTNSPHKRGEILTTTTLDRINSDWPLLSQKLSALSFTFFDQAHPDDIFEVRQSGKLVGIRNFLRRLWAITHTEQPGDFSRMDKLLAEELEEIHIKTEEEWQAIDKKLGPLVGGRSNRTVKGVLNLLIPNGGFRLNTANRLLVSHSGRTDYLKHLSMAIFIGSRP